MSGCLDRSLRPPKAGRSSKREGPLSIRPPKQWDDDPFDWTGDPQSAAAGPPPGGMMMGVSPPALVVTRSAPLDCWTVTTSVVGAALGPKTGEILGDFRKPML